MRERLASILVAMGRPASEAKPKAMLLLGILKTIRVLSREDLDSGAWAARNSELLDLESIDLGARLLISDAP